jgi:tRNA threonylcarbamoyladenosine biosynthesis protein TsaE
LGSGKTTFARALIRALGYNGRVKSPTYGLLEYYPLEQMQVLHLDLYRIGDADELEFLGLADLFDENTIVLVEWPEKSGRWLPEPDFVFDFSYTDSGRDLAWRAQSSAAQKARIEDL